jgi:hypothetical protein
MRCLGKVHNMEAVGSPRVSFPKVSRGSLPYYPEYKERFFFLQILLLRKEGSLYSRVLKNKYEQDDYDEFWLLIVIIFVEIYRITCKLLHFNLLFGSKLRIQFCQKGQKCFLFSHWKNRPLPCIQTYTVLHWCNGPHPVVERIAFCRLSVEHYCSSQLRNASCHRHKPYPSLSSETFI